MSKQRSLRKARFDDDDEDGGGIGAGDGPTAAADASVAAIKAAQRQKAKERRAEKSVTTSKKPLTTLSFDDEEEEGDAAAAAPRPLNSKKNRPGLRIPVNAAPPPSRASSYAQVSSAGEYTAEKLRELQQGTQRAPATAAAVAAPPSYVDAGGYMNLDTGYGAGTEKTAAGEEDDDEPDVGGGGGRSSAIPDAATIKMAKQKRGKSRAAQFAPDFIGIDSGNAAAGDWGAAAAAPATAMAGSDSDAEREPEETMRLRFGATEAHGAPPIHYSEGGGGGEGEEEDADAWAVEQARNGMRTAQLRGDIPLKTAASKADGAFQPPRGGSASAVAAAREAADATVEGLRAALQRAQLSQKQAERNLERTDQSYTDCLADIEGARAASTSAADRYAYLQRLRAYVTDLCAMLAEKSPLVEELQDELARTREERAAAAARRAADEDAERLAPAEAAVAAVVRVLETSGDGRCAGEAAEAAWTAAEAGLERGTHIPIQLDEFGRDENAHRRAQVAARVAARAARPPSPADDGDATSSEDEEAAAAAGRRESDVFEAAESAFRDADDEFSSLEVVKSRLEEWKLRYPAQYADAYMSDSVPALFAPFVRAQLLHWNPVGVPYVELATQQWHELLFDYGMVHKDNANDATNGTAPPPRHDDADVDLIPRLVKALALPVALAAVERQWNPRSALQSASVAAALEELSIYVPPEAMVGVTDATLARLEEEAAAAARTMPAWPPAALALCPRAAAEAARRFNRGVRVLKSAAAFVSVLPAARLQEVAVARLGGGGLAAYVAAAGGDPGEVARRACKVFQALPAAWKGQRGLERIEEAVQGAVRRVEGEAGLEARRAAAAPAAAALAQCLREMGKEADARRLAMMFGVAN